MVDSRALVYLAIPSSRTSLECGFTPADSMAACGRLPCTGRHGAGRERRRRCVPAGVGVAMSGSPPVRMQTTSRRQWWRSQPSPRPGRCGGRGGPGGERGHSTAAHQAGGSGVQAGTGDGARSPDGNGDPRGVHAGGGGSRSPTDGTGHTRAMLGEVRRRAGALERQVERDAEEREQLRRLLANAQQQLGLLLPAPGNAMQEAAMQGDAWRDAPSKPWWRRVLASLSRRTHPAALPCPQEALEWLLVSVAARCVPRCCTRLTQVVL